MAAPWSWFTRPLVSLLPGTAVRNARPDSMRRRQDRHELVVSMVEKQLQNGVDPEEVLEVLKPLVQRSSDPSPARRL